MKLFFYTILFTFSSLIANAQLTVNVGPSALYDSTFVVPYGMSDSVHLPHQYYNRYYVCDNGVLILDGMTSSSLVKVFLEPSAKLIMKDPYFYPTVYMRTGAMLDATGGMQMLSLHRESIAYLSDTSNVNFMFDSVHTSISFTFTGWPGGTKPCSVVSSSNDLNLDWLTSIRFENQHMYYSLKEDKHAQLQLFDITGKCIQTIQLNTQSGIVDTDIQSSGVYFLKLTQSDKVYTTKFMIY